MISLYHQISNLAQRNGFDPREVLEPLSVIQDVEAHRQFWRPETLRVVLLAESHVFTAEDANLTMHPSADVLGFLPASIPNKFVRFVYCLGYGEDLLVGANPAIEPNAGTWQFWKIFQACGMGFGVSAGVLGKDEKNAVRRINNKIRLLSRLKEMGVWLMDASCVAIAPKNSFTREKKFYSEIIQTCLQSPTDGEAHSYSLKAIETAQGSARVVIIGVGVDNAIGGDVRAMCGSENVITIPQPQGVYGPYDAYLKTLSDACMDLRENFKQKE
jgi:hypothetical protein